MSRRKKSPSLIMILPIAFAGLVLAMLLIFPKKNDSTEDLREGLSYISSLDNRNVSAINSIIANADKASSDIEASISIDITATDNITSVSDDSPDKTSTATPETDSPIELFKASLQEQIETGVIAALSEAERAEYRKRLENCVVIGDSMAQAVLEYGFLDSSHVFYRRGYAIGQLSEAIEEASMMLPDTVIFFTGLNDTDYYPEIADYQKAYLEKLIYAKELMPQAKIYVCSMLPPSNALGAVRPDLARAPFYDIALKDMCLQNGTGYIDTTWMVNQSLYMADGIHFLSSFYDVWVKYICACTGL